MLRDIQAGALGSATASTNPVYFHEYNGLVLFAADGGADASGLWNTNGTSAGTKLLVKRPMRTIVGITGNKLLYHDYLNFFAMALQ